MSEPFHRYHARRQLERDLTIPTLDAPAFHNRLPRYRRLPGISQEWALFVGAIASGVLGFIAERIS